MGFNLKLLLRSLVFAFIFSLICFFLLALVLSFSNLSESIIRPSSYIIMIISIVFGSGYVTRRVEKNGWLYGGITGLLYVLILIIIGAFTGKGLILDTFLISRLFMGAITGIVGGMLGINLR